MWTDNSSEAYPLNPSSQAPSFIKLEFEEKISPEEVNEIQFLTNDPQNPTAKTNKLTKLYTEFLEGIKAQTTEIMESRAKIISKYTPKQIKK